MGDLKTLIFYTAASFFHWGHHGPRSIDTGTSHEVWHDHAGPGCRRRGGEKTAPAMAMRCWASGVVETAEVVGVDEAVVVDDSCGGQRETGRVGGCYVVCVGES
ncbi:hypothetical protein E2562_015790 [Oryza meyeriana var. granulata]|uniref:Uncharacterized protein n=1 Tax=Oryza meyeriana var. granulata TaxID=110450 RepID=A0A6G1D4J1_9ORYZ|nr:hypothetical protein E2562_015790 [Oryza meyeriana var. granulata]